MVAEILRVSCNSEDQCGQASLPVKFAGLGVNQTKVIASCAYVGSCALTRDLVAALLGQDSYEPTGVAELLSLHEAATGTSHDFESLSTIPSVQQLLYTERHVAVCTQLRAKVSALSNVARLDIGALNLILLLGHNGTEASSSCRVAKDVANAVVTKH